MFADQRRTTGGTMKLTGERPMEGRTPDSLLALHEAGYREVAACLGTGLILDVGCGVGDESITLASEGRRLFGIDYSADTAILASQEWGTNGSKEHLIDTACMDGGTLAFRSECFDAVCSSHIIEHFTDPERHVAELARVCSDSGAVYVLTPNRPADFENPFHVYLFEQAQLASMLRLFFEDVEVKGLNGDEALLADFATRRSSGERLLKLDYFNLRRRLPRKLYVWAYEHALPLVYRALGSNVSGVGSGLDHTHLYLTDEVDDTTPVLFAIAKGPRRPWT